MRSRRITFHVCCATALFLSRACGISVASDGASVTVTVNPSSTRPISPYIYGINHASKIEGVPKALTLDRSGGNRWTAYNWENNASNAGSDYGYQNDDLVGSDSEAGSGVYSLIAEDRKRGMASIVTFQLQGLVAADTKGPVPTANPPDRTRFKKVVNEKKSVSDAPFTAKPPTSDDNVYMDEFMWAIDHEFAGDNVFGARPAKQPVFIALDNEPELWKSTHLEVQGPASVSVDSFRTSNAHCAAKQSSATVATLRPTKIDDSGESHRHCRSRSTRGSTERKAQAAAKIPESQSCWAT